LLAVYVLAHMLAGTGRPDPVSVHWHVCSREPEAPQVAELHAPDVVQLHAYVLQIWTVHACVVAPGHVNATAVPRPMGWVSAPQLESGTG